MLRQHTGDFSNKMYGDVWLIAHFGAIKQEIGTVHMASDWLFAKWSGVISIINN